MAKISFLVKGPYIIMISIHKKIFNCRQLLLLALCGIAFTEAFSGCIDYCDTNLEREFSDFEDFMFDECNGYDAPDSLLDIEAPTRALTPIQIMQLLNQVGAPTILMESFFLRTNILNSRSLLDMPLFDPRYLGPCGCSFDTMIFYNQMTRSYFTLSSDRIDSYVALSEPSLLEKLQNQVVNFLPNVNIAMLFGLFSGMTVQERRAGFMLHWMRQTSDTVLRIFCPLYYRERNFFFTQDERRAIEAVFPPVGTQSEQEEFQNAHFVSDEIGLGDLRVEGMCCVRPQQSLRIWLGGFVTIPTAFAFKRGLRGTHFPKSCQQPNFDLNTLFNDSGFSPTPEMIEQAQEMVSSFALQAIDRVAANLLDTELGNNRHVGLGIVALYTSPLSEWIDYECMRCIFFKGRISVEGLLPAYERRLFVYKVDTQGFATRDFSDSSSNAVALSNLLFLQKEFINKFYLFGSGATVLPGPIFRATNTMFYQTDSWKCFLGTDWWVQTRESMPHVYSDAATVNSFDLAKNKLPHAVQYKLLAGLDYTLYGESCDLTMGLALDATVYSRGIGKDFTGLVHCSVCF